MFVAVTPAIRNDNSITLPHGTDLLAIVCRDQPQGKTSWTVPHSFFPRLIPSHSGEKLYLLTMLANRYISHCWHVLTIPGHWKVYRGSRRRDHRSFLRPAVQSQRHTGRSDQCNFRRLGKTAAANHCKVVLMSNHWTSQIVNSFSYRLPQSITQNRHIPKNVLPLEFLPQKELLAYPKTRWGWFL